MTQRIGTFSVVVFATLTVATVAEAQCDHVTLNSATTLAIVGMQSSAPYHPVVCEYDSTGLYLTRTVATGCIVGPDLLRITANALDNVVHPVYRSVGGSCAMDGYGFTLLGLWVDAGAGEDFIQGTDASDLLYSTDGSYSPDSDDDVLCGYGDRDALEGDPGTGIDHLDGGMDHDWCMGVWAFPPPYGDFGYQCEDFTTPIDLNVVSSALCTFEDVAMSYGI